MLPLEIEGLILVLSHALFGGLKSQLLAKEHKVFEVFPYLPANGFSHSCPRALGRRHKTPPWSEVKDITSTAQALARE